MPLGQALAAPQGSDVLLWELALLPEGDLRALLDTHLTDAERVGWESLSPRWGPRREWLSGRVCLKEAVCAWFHARHGVLLAPRAVVVRHDDLGAPWVEGPWDAAPRVSLSHNRRLCVAAVAAPDHAIGVDIEDLERGQRSELLIEALTPMERGVVNAAAARGDALLRTWCAKEAASKLLGTGLQGDPAGFPVSFSDSSLSLARVRRGPAVVEVSFMHHGQAVLALAARHAAA